MDTFAHAAAGILLCSKTGLPGGFTGPVGPDGHRRRLDMTLFAAAAFGTLPDLCSFAIPLVMRVWHGMPLGKPELHEIPAFVFVNYQLTHSLVIAAIVLLLLWKFYRPLLLPALAWPLHILCDIPTHGKSYFATPFLYPISDYSFDGWGFASHFGIVYGYWAVLLLLMVAVIIMRYIGQRRASAAESSPEPLESDPA